MKKETLLIDHCADILTNEDNNKERFDEVTIVGKDVKYRPYRVYAYVRYTVDRFTKKASSKIESVKTLLRFACTADKDALADEINKAMTKEKLIPRVLYESFPPIGSGLINILDWKIIMEDSSEMTYQRLQEKLTVEEFVTYCNQFK